jgi:di/tricarboxylate transporter
MHKDLAHALRCNRDIFRGQLINGNCYPENCQTYAVFRSNDQLNLNQKFIYQNDDVVVFNSDNKVHLYDFKEIQLLSYWEEQPHVNYRLLLSIFFIASMVVMIILNSLQIVDLYILATFILIIFLLFKLSTWDKVVKETNWTIYLLLASSVGLGKALKESNIIEEVADIISPMFKDISIVPTLFILHILTVMLSSLLNSPTVLAIMIPIGHTVTTRYDLDSQIFYMVIMIACSTSFLTSFSYQTNTMVQSLVQYRHIDYFKYGLILTILCCPITVFCSWLFF